MAKYKQNAKDRRDESRAMRGGRDGGTAPFPGLEDGRQASEVKPISANSEQYDLGKVRWNSVGSKGYPSQAFDYKY